MNRRGFLGMLVGGVATAAAVRSWPFRVYGFYGRGIVEPTLDEINLFTMECVVPVLADDIFKPSPFLVRLRNHQVGEFHFSGWES